MNELPKVNSMKPSFISFAMFHRELGAVTIEFTYDDRGKPNVVIVKIPSSGSQREIDNADGKYKPCVKHCRNVVLKVLSDAMKPEPKPPAKRRPSKVNGKMKMIGGPK